ncbi:MAG: SPOR domain-containing protein [Caldimonas sp.]
MFKQKSDSASPAAPADPVQQARTRARQRLIGAIVLLAIGIIGFPLVFETQPRPIPVDIPIEIPKKDALPPLVASPAIPASPTAGTALPPSARTRPAASPGAASVRRLEEEIITESRAEAGREVDAARPAPSATARAGSAPSVRVVASGPARPAASVPARFAASAPPRVAASATARAEASAASEPRRVATASAPPLPAVPVAAPKTTASVARGDADGDRARALLEGRPVGAGAEASRFVVQVGAFADAEAARETRLKVEKLGLKTYTQVAQTASGSRIRVRIGPFGSRGDADAALAKARAAGLTAVVLTL